jgi:hypothetical protein
MGLDLVVFECFSELLQLIEKTKHLTGSRKNNLIACIIFMLYCKLDRTNFSSYVAMKKSGLIYVNSDGRPSNKDVVASGINGDCVVLKNGSLVSAVCDQPAFFICENKLARSEFLLNYY